MPGRTRQQTEDYWSKLASSSLKGRTIVLVRYLTEEEREAYGWLKRPVVLQLDDGSLIFPSADDEGNEAGSLFGQSKEGVPIAIPTLG